MYRPIVGCGASVARQPLGELFAAADVTAPRQKLQPDSTPADWLAFFDLRSPEADAIVDACAAIGAVRAADVLLVSDEELASMRVSLRLPIPRRKFDRALRALRSAAKHAHGRVRPGSAAAFRAQLAEGGAQPDSPGREPRLSSEAEHCPFCDLARPAVHPPTPKTAPTTPQGSPIRTIDSRDGQQGFSTLDAGRSPLRAPSWNPWQQAPGIYSAGWFHSLLCICYSLHPA